MKAILLIILVFVSNEVFSNPEPIFVNQYPELEHGLKLKNIKKCQKQVGVDCQHHEKLSQLLNCAHATMQNKPYCQQNVIFLDEQKALIKSVSSLGNIGLIYAKILSAENKNSYFMVDVSGQIIKPTGYLNLKHARNFKLLKQKYSKIELWRQVVNPPRYQSLANGEQQLIFKQILLNGCHGCEQVGIATVVYQFTKDGLFKGTKVTELTPSANDHVLAS